MWEDRWRERRWVEMVDYGGDVQLGILAKVCCVSGMSDENGRDDMSALM